MKKIQVKSNINVWYEQNIEKPIRPLVKLLRDYGFNTTCSCGHTMTVSCDYKPDGEVDRLHGLLFNNGYRNYVIVVEHLVLEGHSYSFMEIKLNITKHWRDKEMIVCPQCHGWIKKRRNKMGVFLAKKLPNGNFQLMCSVNGEPMPVTDYIEGTEWITRGSIKIRRSALSADDPESWQAMWIAKFGSMEGFPYKQLGWDKPKQTCPHCGKEI